MTSGRRVVDLVAVEASRARLRALFQAHPDLRVPTLDEVAEMTQWVYTPEQVAVLAQVIPGTARRWLRTGALEGVRLPGGTWRVHESALRAFLGYGATDSLPSPDELDRRRDEAGE